MIGPGEETVAFALRLRPGSEADYKHRHDTLWADMRDALLGAGILHYEIHLSRADNLLFAFIIRRRDHTMHTLPQNEAFQRWQAYMADLLVTTDGQVRVPLAPMFALSA